MPASLLPVVERLFDDAGLFPPAAHAMADALGLHERARTGAHGRLVGPFLCPVARVAELDACVAGGAPRPPELSLVAYPGESPWRRLALRPGVVQIEGPLDLVLPEDAQRVVRYVELPGRGPVEAAVDDVVRVRARVKVRCGGLTPDAVPSTRRLAEVLAACAARRVALKATAGLHHAFYRAPTQPGGAPQHGFLNLLAAGSAAALGESVEGLVDLLETEADDRDKVVVRIDRAARTLIASIGTCSIYEPVGELQALGLLAP